MLVLEDQVIRCHGELFSLRSVTSSTHDTFGIIAVIIGVLLTLGGLMFFLAATLFLSPDLPLSITIAPLVQVGMGLLAVLSGVLSFRKNSISKWLFVFVLTVVMINVGILIWSILPFIQSV